jgi:methylated-DNA-[protein]-cysteine S-methyltransferase
VSPRLPTPTATLVRSLRESSEGFDDATRDRLRALLASKAAEAGVLDVAYRTVDSPLGPLLLATTPVGLVRVAFAVEGHDEVLGRLAADVSPRILAVPQRLDEAARQLDDYFARRRRAFDLPIDLRLARGFRRTVLEHLPEIPYGSTASYAAVAGASGNPAAVRAAASACSHNPLPLVVPCHRVVRSDGTIGNYLAGTVAKQALLDLEAAA